MLQFNDSCVPELKVLPSSCGQLRADYSTLKEDTVTYLFSDPVPFFTNSGRPAAKVERKLSSKFKLSSYVKLKLHRMFKVWNFVGAISSRSNSRRDDNAEQQGSHCTSVLSNSAAHPPPSMPSDCNFIFASSQYLILTS